VELQERIQNIKRGLKLQDFTLQNAIKEHTKYIKEYKEDLEYYRSLLEELGDGQEIETLEIKVDSE
jgi:hypothetical protein